MVLMAALVQMVGVVIPEHLEKQEILVPLVSLASQETLEYKVPLDQG